MDISPAPERRAPEIAGVVAAELEHFSSPDIVNALRKFLVEPRLELRQWDWSRDHIELPTWVIAESSKYDYGIVYAERGFGPSAPWGLVFSSANNFGADYCWYTSLQSAFEDSRLIEESREESDAA
ncbi:hypothetical protein [Nitrosomonas sp.]|uniref:hypothetical protein n=1 Tax=Nitrosomonas sp. TaxID=42353 RepID=UPI002600A257|nr:hypothetical protein [Nitrosomonas sp.]MCC6917258.1 hypothetical protein [Nitrosomonas sp.]